VAENKGYICIDEGIVDWNSKIKLMPVSIKYSDYIHQVVNQESKAVRSTHYTENSMLQLLYHNNFSIWEALIRIGLLENTVEVNNS